MLWHAVVIICLCFAVCESCIEPIPVCLPGEIMAVDMNTTNHCCPQYHCGSYNKNTSSHCTEVPSHFVCRNETEKHNAFKDCVLIFFQCVIWVCVLSPVWVVLLELCLWRDPCQTAAALRHAAVLDTCKLT